MRSSEQQNIFLLVALWCNNKNADTTLEFKGELVMGVKKDFTPYLELSFSMISIWRKPFGLEWISVGKAKLAAYINCKFAKTNLIVVGTTGLGLVLAVLQI